MESDQLVALAQNENEREKASRTSKLLGEKLLQGWTMLGDYCPNEACPGVPLMRDRKTKQMYCVSCNHFVATEEEDLKDSEPPSKQHKAENPLSPCPAIDVVRDPVSSTIPNLTVYTLLSKMDEERKALAEGQIEYHCKNISRLAKTIGDVRAIDISKV